MKTLPQAPGRRDERFVFQRGQRHHGLGRQRMRGGQRHLYGFAQQGAEPQAGRRGAGVAHEADVRAAGLQGLDLFLRRGLLQRERDGRESAAKIAQRAQQRSIRRDVDEGQREVPVHPLGHAARVRHAFLKRLQHAPGGLQKSSARRRQCHAAVGAFKQRRADFAFQPADGLAERRLRHMQALGGPIEMQRFRDGDKLPQQARFDHRDAHRQPALSPAQPARTGPGPVSSPRRRP
ncbi:hypothetical protein D3C72_1618150 [compost metagenome]